MAQVLKKDLDITQKISVDLLKHLRTDSLKDSVALYTFAIKLKLSNISSRSHIENITINEQFALSLYKDFNFLKNIDFIPLMHGKKRISMVIPVMLLVSETNKATDHRIKIDDLPKKFKAFMNYDHNRKSMTDKYIYLDPQVITIETKVYD